jgi:hypothetical protein
MNLNVFFIAFLLFVVEDCVNCAAASSRGRLSVDAWEFVPKLQAAPCFATKVPYPAFLITSLWPTNRLMASRTVNRDTLYDCTSSLSD